MSQSENIEILGTLDSSSKSHHQIFSKFEEACYTFKAAKSVTDKKNQISRLSEFLNDTRIIKYLDSNTSSVDSCLDVESQKENRPQKKSNATNWNDLFNTVQTFFINEISLIKEKSTSTQSTPNSNATVENKIYQLRALLNLVLNQINSRDRPNLSLSNFLGFYTNIYDLNQEKGASSKSQAKILNDLTNFFVNFIIPFDAYCCEFKRNNWLEFISIYTQNLLAYFSSPEASSSQCLVDLNLSLKCLRRLLSASVRFVDLSSVSSFGPKLFAFFHFIIISIKKDSSPEIIENLIAAFIEFYNNVKYESLFEMCKYGRDICERLIDVFSQRQTATSTKELILRFMLIQVKLHERIKEINESHYHEFLKVMRSIYESMFEHLISLSNQMLLNSKSKQLTATDSQTQSGIKDQLSSLLAYCLASLIQARQSIVTSSQQEESEEEVNNDDPNVTVDELSGDDGEIVQSSSNKRRRIETSPPEAEKKQPKFKVYSQQFVLDQLLRLVNQKQQQEQAKCLTWLRVIEKLISLKREDLADFDSAVGKCLLTNAVSKFDEAKSSNWSRNGGNRQLTEAKLRSDVIHKAVLSLLAKLSNLDLDTYQPRRLLELSFAYSQFDLALKIARDCSSNGDIDFIVSKFLGLASEHLDYNYLNLLAHIRVDLISFEDKLKLVEHLLRAEFTTTSNETTSGFDRTILDLVSKILIKLINIEINSDDQNSSESESMSMESEIDQFYSGLFEVKPTTEVKNSETKKCNKLSNLKIFTAIRDNLLKRTLNTAAINTDVDYYQTLADLYLYGVLMRSLSRSLGSSIVESLSREMKRLIGLLLGQFELNSILPVLNVCCLPEFNYLKSIETTRFGSKLLEELDNPMAIRLLWSINRTSLIQFVVKNRSKIKTNTFFGLFKLTTSINLTPSESENIIGLIEYVLNAFRLDNRLLIELARLLRKPSIRNDKSILKLVDSVISMLASSRISSIECEVEILHLNIEFIGLRRAQIKTILSRLLSDFHQKPAFIRLKIVQLLIRKFFSTDSDLDYEMSDMLFDRLYSTLVLNNKQFEQEEINLNMSISSLAQSIENDLSSLKRVYSQIRRAESDPVYNKHMVLYFFRSLILDRSVHSVVSRQPKLLSKCLFGLIQISLEYPAYFGRCDILPLIVDYPLLAPFAEKIVQQCLSVYLFEWNDDDEVDLDQLVAEKIPLDLLGCSSVDEFRSSYSHLVFEHCLNEFGKLPKKWIFNEKFETISKCVSLKQALISSKPTSIDLDFVKKHLFIILDSFLDTDPEKTSLLLLTELKRAKFKPPADSSSYAIYQLLIKTMRSIYDNRAYFSLFYERFSNLSRFIETCLLGPSILALVGEYKLVIDYICLGVLTNSLEIFKKQSFAQFQPNISQFLSHLFDLFQSLVDYLHKQSLVTIFDFGLSCFTWNLLSYLNELNTQIKADLIGKIVELVRSLSDHSIRFHRLFKFLSNSSRIDNNRLLMSGLTNSLPTELKMDLDWSKELAECLSSSDMRNRRMFEFMLVYVAQILVLSERRGLSKSALNSIIRLVVERLDRLGGDDERCRELAAFVFSLIGPVYDPDMDGLEAFISQDENHHRFIMDRFENGQNSGGDSAVFYRFYFGLFENLCEALNDENIEMQEISNRLLGKIINSSEFAVFMLAYESHWRELQKSTAENEDIKGVSNNFRDYYKVYSLKKSSHQEEYDEFPDSNESSILSNSRLWRLNDDSKGSYSCWIKRFLIDGFLRSGLIRDSILLKSIRFLERRIDCCEDLVRFVFLKILFERGDESAKANLGRNLAQVFNYTQRTSTDFKKSIQLFIRVIEFLIENSIKRSKNGEFWSQPKEEAFWDELDFLKLAKSAQSVNRYETSIYFVEVWTNQKINSEKTCLELLKSNPVAIEIIMEAFKNLDDIAAIDSELIYLLEPKKQMNFNELLLTSDECLNIYDNYLNCQKDEKSSESHLNAKVGLINSLRSIGLNYTLNKVLSSEQKNFINQNCSDFSAMKYGLSWKLGLWEQSNDDQSDASHSFYTILSHMKQNDKDFRQEPNLTELMTEFTNQSIKRTKLELIEELSVATNVIDERQRLNRILSSAYGLEEITSRSRLVLLDDDKKIKDLYLGYERELFDRRSSFELLDDLNCLRLQLAKIAVQSSNQNECLEEHMKSAGYLEFLYECLIDNAINYKKYQIGQVYVDEMGFEAFIDKQKRNLKEAELLTSRQSLKRAKFLLKSIIDMFEENKPAKSVSIASSKTNMDVYIKALDLYGQLLAGTNAMSPEQIMSEYFERSVNISTDDERLKIRTLYSLARFADDQYVRTCGYLNSSEFEARADLMRKFGSDASKTRLIEPNSYFNRILSKQFDMDREHVRMVTQNRDAYLLRAVQCYLSCLASDSSSDQTDNACVFRLVSLWTENMSQPNVLSAIEQSLFKIPTHKFCILLHQLAARMSLKEKEAVSNPNSEFQRLLIQLITNISSQHPHHALPILFAFVNALKDSPDTDNDANSLNSDRINTANHILNKLKSGRIKEIIDSMSRLCEAYIELANNKIPTQKSNKSEAIQFPKTLLITKIRNLTQIAILTDRLPIDITGSYPENRIASVVRFEDRYRVANGLNQPKIVMCLASDGRPRKQLVKGRDDLRQDAVMQQFFETVNHLIVAFNCESFDNRRLSLMRTYRVVPLSQRSGVLEWCLNTITIGDWLIGSQQDGGAHKKYRPYDLNFNECKRMLHECHQQLQQQQQSLSSKNRESTSRKRHHQPSKLETFELICSKFKPVFRHFFTETFADVRSWHRARHAYTTSCATASIVGYVVGLGDRHVQNILIDTTTAELVHIDLGIAFEQGKILPIPETVPFRLTRDIVDGFGVCALHGLFRSNCELALELLKRSKEFILTIFEVLLYDPLHNWSLSPSKAYALQQTADVNTPPETTTNTSLLTSIQSESDSPIIISNTSKSATASSQKNKIAERILYQIKQKLSGYENNSELSTLGQVNYLINQATSAENLCQIYVGWQPYL